MLDEVAAAVAAAGVVLGLVVAAAAVAAVVVVVVFVGARVRILNRIFCLRGACFCCKGGQRCV